ncbi:MAG: acyl-CoA dehydrogenase family protein [Pseudomonadota bacterium]
MEDIVSYRARADRFVAEEIAPRQAEWAREHGVSPEVWRRAGELGLVSPDLPVQWGGGGGDYRHFAALLEARGKHDDRSWGISNQAIVVQYLHHHGTPAQQARYLRRLAQGELLGAIAMTEPHTGSDLKNIRANAVRIPGGWRLNGRKTFISHVRYAGLVVVAARSTTEDGREGVSLFLVEPSQAPGYRIVKHLDKLGQRGIDTSEIALDNVEVADDALLGGAPGKGFRQMMSDLPYERMIVAVSAIATMERAFALAVDYTRERTVFGQPVAQFQHTRFKLAEIKTRCVIGRSFVDSCIDKQVAGTLDSATASMAKLWLSETSFSVVDDCLQMFGGQGYIHDEHPIAQIFADSRAERIYGGTSEVMKEIIARTI